MKNKRQEEILRLIRDHVIVTQDDLQNALCKLGYQVTQSTVSRDIKELRIVKAQDAAGQYRYISAYHPDNDPKQVHSERFVDVFKRAVIQIDYAMNDVVVKCYAGMASSACVAIDHLFGEMIVGSLAGDDTILAITRSEAEAVALAAKLKKLL
jgi:transcriptional regulator of arginine metabolism